MLPLVLLGLEGCGQGGEGTTALATASPTSTVSTGDGANRGGMPPNPAVIWGGLRPPMPPF